MRRFSLLRYFAAVFSVGLGSAAGAQDAAPKDIQTVPFPILGIGGGISVPAGGFAKGRVPGFNLSALAEFRTPSEPLGIRAEALYQYFGKKENAVGATSSNTFAAVVNVMYHAPKSQIRPYIIAGMGLYHIPDQGNNAGLNGGVGLSIPLTGMGAYAEARVHAAITQGPAFVTIPISFGITF